MNKVAQYYRELVSSLTTRLERGERDIDALVDSARQRMNNRGELTRSEIDDVSRAVRRDLEEFARSYAENQQELGDSVFMRVIRQSLWKELADITDKSQLECPGTLGLSDQGLRRDRGRSAPLLPPRKKVKRIAAHFASSISGGKPAKAGKCRESSATDTDTSSKSRSSWLFRGKKTERHRAPGVGLAHEGKELTKRCVDREVNRTSQARRAGCSTIRAQ